MAGDIEYRLVVKDDGTAVLKKVSAQVEATGQAGTKAGKETEEGFERASRKIRQTATEASNFERAIERLQRTVVAFIGVAIFQKVVSGFTSLIEQGIEYNKTMETSKLGIASLLAANGTFTDSQGKALEGYEAINAGMKMSSTLVQQLQEDNLKTAATYEQLVKAFQQTLAPGLSAGFNVQQIRSYTLAMVQAATALGINRDMLAEETRSMLRGTITPRNTLIATALGVRNEDIAKYKNDADGLYKYVMSRLSSFGEAGEIAQTTWEGVTSNLFDAIKMTLGKGLEPFFNYIKSEMLALQKNLVTFTPGGVEYNTAAVQSAEVFGKSLTTIWELCKKIGRSFLEWAEFLGPVVGALNNIATFVFDYIIGKMFELIQMSASGWNKINSSLSEMAANFMDWFQGGKLINEAGKSALVAQPTGWGGEYKPRPLTYGKEELDELNKLRIAVGYIGNEEREVLENVNARYPIGRDLNDLSVEQLNIILKINREMEKSTLLDKDRLLYITLIQTQIAKIGNIEEINNNNAKLQLAQTNKDYALQAQLIKRNTDLQKQKLVLDKKNTDINREALDLQEKVKLTQLGQTASSEMLGYREETENLKASMAGITGDLEKQIKFEYQSLQTSIQKRKVNNDLRGILGEQVEDLLLERFEMEAIKRLELNRIDYANRLLSLKEQEAGMTGNYKEQAKYILEQNKNQVEQLTLEGKLFGIDGERIKNQMNANAILKSDDVILKGQIELEKKRLEYIEKIGSANVDFEAEIKAQIGIREQELKIVQRMVDISTDPEIKKMYKDIADLMGQYSKAEESSKRLQRSFTQAQTAGQYKSDLADLVGNYNLLLMAESDLAFVEYKRALALDDLSESAKEYATLIYDEKIKEIQAQKELNFLALNKIAMNRYALETNQSLINQLGGILPSSIDTATSSISDFMMSLSNSTDSASNSLDTLLNTLSQGIQRLIFDISLAIVKMEILRSLGYGTGGVSSGGNFGTVGGLIGSLLGLGGGGGGEFLPGVPLDMSSAEYVPGITGHNGGYIPEYHRGGEVTAKLLKGEFVVNRKGVSTLDKLNEGDVSAFGRANSESREGYQIVNNWNINAMDALTFRQFAYKNRDVFADMNLISKKDNHQLRRS